MQKFMDEHSAVVQSSIVSNFCCTKFLDVVKYRKQSGIKGPVETGFSIIANVTVGTAEFINIRFCPFCGLELINDNKLSV